MAMADTAEKPTVDERYQSATGTSNLRVDTRDGAPITSADVILAAGMSDSRLGMALLRLHSEYDSAAKPRKLNPAQIKALSLTMKDAKGRPDIMRARREAAAWYASELRLLAQSLKSRGAVLEQMMLWATMKGIPGDAVSAALHYWLNSVCGDCGGLGFLKVPEQPALSARRCSCCHGNGVVERPEGTTRLLNHIDYLLQQARNSLGRRLRG
jgi:hypothetical protein